MGRGIGHAARGQKMLIPKKILLLGKQDSLRHGGILRKKRSGRGYRPLSTRDSLHLVLKADRRRLRTTSLRTHQNFLSITNLIQKYSRRFYIKVDQYSIQADHIHVLIQASKRSNYMKFFRVLSGQIAQQLKNNGRLRVTDTPTPTQTPSPGTGLWIYRPFSQVVQGRRAHRVMQDYIQLNEQEALGRISYSKLRLKGLSRRDWEILWS